MPTAVFSTNKESDLVCTNRLDELDEAREPCPRCLAEAIQRPRQETHRVRLSWVGEAGGLLAVDTFLQVAMEEGVGDVEVTSRHPFVAMIVRTLQIVAGLTTGVKVSPKSIPGHWLNPRTTQRALYRSRHPSDLSLCLNTHLLVITRAPGGLSTSCHVRFLWSASNSSCITLNQLGSQRVERTEEGSGDAAAGASAVIAYFGLGLNMPDRARIVIGWRDAEGGEAELGDDAASVDAGPVGGERGGVVDDVGAAALGEVPEGDVDGAWGSTGWTRPALKVTSSSSTGVAGVEAWGSVGDEDNRRGNTRSSNVMCLKVRMRRLARS